jgi:hypothetical protein
MRSSGMLCRVACKNRFRVGRIGEVGTLVVTSNRRTLQINAIAIWPNIPEDWILLIKAAP